MACRSAVYYAASALCKTVICMDGTLADFLRRVFAVLSTMRSMHTKREITLCLLGSYGARLTSGNQLRSTHTLVQSSWLSLEFKFIFMFRYQISIFNFIAKILGKDLNHQILFFEICQVYFEVYCKIVRVSDSCF